LTRAIAVPLTLAHLRLFDDGVGADQDRWRHREVRGLGRLEIDDKFELGRLLDGDIGRPGAFEDEVDNLGAAPPLPPWSVP
jgi:hypothetical protein